MWEKIVQFHNTPRLPKYFPGNTTPTHTDSITVKIDTVYIQNKTKKKDPKLWMTIGIDWIGLTFDPKWGTE